MQFNKNDVFLMDYLEGLNEPQRKAVLYTEGPLMIIAGAGSGKTRVLTHRIAHLINHGVDAFNILALTFTNKAAKEMRNRIERIVGTEAKGLWMGTFHSMFAKILRFEGEKLGYGRDFSIYDTDDSKSLIRAIVKERGLDDKLYRPNIVLNRISSAKNRLISYKTYNEDPAFYQEDLTAKRPEIGVLYETYQRRCFKSNAMDFDDLLFNTNILFRDFPDVLKKYQHKFRYVLIDEFQDTNFSQYLIVRQISFLHKNICVVGDDAQSIYAFRGADIQNILNFEKDYPELETIRLEQNYRSTQNIVKAANSLIAKNKSQLEKNVWTNNDDGKLIKVVKAMSDTEEGRLIADSIFEEKMNNNLTNEDFAILYRTNAQSRSMEEALRKKNIKYRIIGGLSFYQRKEIKDLIAYLRFSINHNDEEAFKRVINLPKRGIGATSVAKMLVYANENRQSIWEVLQNIKQFMKGRIATAIENFAILIKSFEVLAKEKDAFTVASEVAKNSGLLRDLNEDKTIEGLSRYENVQELLNAIKEFVDNPDNNDKSLSAFLQEVSLITSADQAEDDDDEKVTLMTVHMAKGLEFPHVYVVGMEENLFPSQMMLNNRKDLEEERRLFYVAITRAEQKLTLSYATTRYRYGNLNYCEASRFLDEIDESYLQKQNNDWSSSSTTSKSVGKSLNDNSFVHSLKTRHTRLTPQKKHQVSSSFTPSDTSSLAKGMKVEHAKFGFGLVKKIEEYNGDRKAVIDFQDIGEKTLLLSFAKLKIHS